MASTSYVTGQRKFSSWLSRYGIRLSRTIDLGLQQDNEEWDHFAFEMRVKNAIYPEVETQSFSYMQGTAHTKAPKLTDLMAALLPDASCVVDRSFEEFCSDLGYDTDSRKADEIYRQIQINNGKLMRLFRVTDLRPILTQSEPLREEAGL